MHDKFKSKTDKKKVVSNILSSSRDWHNSNDVKPEENTQVVMRICDPSKSYGETEEEIYVAEDIKVGVYIPDENDPNKGEWFVSPPYPKYDFSPLTNREKLKEGASVTHWAEVNDDELDDWSNRFEPRGEYNRLRIDIDPEYEEYFYRLMIHQANAINSRITYMESQEKPNTDEIEQLKLILTFFDDIQACIDTHTTYIDGQKVTPDMPERDSLIARIKGLDHAIGVHYNSDQDTNFMYNLESELMGVIRNIHSLIDGGPIIGNETDHDTHLEDNTAVPEQLTKSQERRKAIQNEGVDHNAVE